MQHTFYVHFFAVVLYGYNEKRPNYTFYGGNVVFIFSGFLPTKLILFVQFLSLALALCLFSTSM